MEVANWQFAQRFEDLRQRALRFSCERRDLLNAKSEPLITWEGSTKALDCLCDPRKKPPLAVLNPERAKPCEEFVCWLMLPNEYGKKWYFGRVASQRHSLADELRAFRAIASEAGSLLRRDSVFSEYLSPCVSHLRFASRFPAFNDHVDASYWCALIFTRPNIGGLLNFPYERTVLGNVIAQASIANPFKLTAQAISRWSLNSSRPMSASGTIVRPYDWPATIPKSETRSGMTDDGEDDPVEDVLTLQKLTLYRDLKKRKHRASFDSLAKLRNCWRVEEPCDETIVAGLKRLRKELNKIPDYPVRLVIEAKDRQGIRVIGHD